MCKLLLLDECIFFIYNLIKCGLICQKVVRGDMTTIILNNQWNSLISEYDLVHVEINKSKVDVLVEDFFAKGCIIYPTLQ